MGEISTIEAIHAGERIPVLNAVKDQWGELKDVEETVTCPCGAETPVKRAFQCFYCEVWFCPGCAEQHFEEGRDD